MSSYDGQRMTLSRSCQTKTQKMPYSRADLGWICSIRLSKIAGIAGYFEDFVRLRRKDRPKSQIRLWRGWPEVADPPLKVRLQCGGSVWRAEMPKCQVISDPALSLVI